MRRRRRRRRRAHAPARRLALAAHAHEPRAAASLLNNLLEVLCAYAYTYRLFCGGASDDPAEAGAALLQLGSSQTSPPRNGTADAALPYFADGCTNTPAVATSPILGGGMP